MIKKLLFLLLPIYIFCNVSGQSASTITDSLILRLEKAKTEEKAQLLNQLAQSYLPANPGKCMLYAGKALELSIQQNNPEQQAIANKNIGASYSTLYKYDDALKAYDKVLEYYRKTGNKQEIASIYINIGLAYREKSNYSEAQAYFTKALNVYQSLENQSGKANIQNMLGSLAWRRGDYQLALNHYLEALKIRESMKVNSEVASSYSYVAMVYKDLNKFDSAVIFYQKALELRKKNNNPISIANTLNDIGNVYWQKQDWEKALEYYFRSIKLRYDTGDKMEIANSYINIGNLYSNLGNIDKAKEYFQLALAIYNNNKDERKLATTLTLLGNIGLKGEQLQEALSYYNKALGYRKNIGEQKEIAASFNNLGNVYSKLGQTSKGIKYFEEALKIRKEINDVNGEITTLNDMGNVYEKINNLPMAQSSIEHAYELATKTGNTYYIGLCARKIAEGLLRQNKEGRAFELLTISNEAGRKINNAELLKKTHKTLFDYYQAKKDFKLALDHYIRYSEINDSMQNNQNTLKMLSVQQNLELEKTNNELKNFENEVKLLRQKEDLQTLALSKQKFILIFLLTIIVLITITGILLYNRYLIKKKHNTLLKEQNTIIEESNNRLKQSEEDLTKLNATKDKYFAVIAHDIRNPLSSLLNLSQLIIEKFDTLDSNQIQDFNKMIYESATNLFDLLENLLNWARTNTNKMRFNPLPMKLAPIANNIILLNKLSASQKNITVQCNITDDIEVYADLQMLTSILRNLVSNALKFTPEGGQVSIDAKDKISMISITVSDTGIGITPGDVEKLFRLDKHFTTRGTLNETGTGLGLILVKEFVDKNNGKITLSSEPGKGSRFCFTLPTGK